MIKFKGLIAPTEVPTGDGRMFAKERMTHRPCPLPLMAKFEAGSHAGATPVGKITDIFPGPGGYWATGYFLDPALVPEVPKAVYMIQEKVMGPSVDLDMEFAVKIVTHPTKPDRKAKFFEEYNVIGTTLVPMPAFYQVHLSVDNEQEKTLLASAGVDTSMFTDDLESIDLGNPELITASITSDDEAECGCDEEEFSQGIVPMSETESGSVSHTPLTFTVSGAERPTTVTLTFDSGSIFHRYDMPSASGPGMGDPLAVVKVLEDKTIVKVPTSSYEEKEECYFDADGNCPVCGY